MTKANLLFLLLTISFAMAACGQKGPLIVERTNDAPQLSQEGLPAEISPEDGSESESESTEDGENQTDSDE